MSDESGQSKRQRSRHSKSRGGCITCRSRHVKCDEGHPHCERCINGGRECGGYPSRNDPSVTMQLVEVVRRTRGTKAFKTAPSFRLVRDIGTEAENRAFEFFQWRTVPAFSGLFEAKFWSSILLAASRQEPAVKHALMSLSSLHEAFENHSEDSVSKFSEDIVPKFALEEYNKAIKVLTKFPREDTATIQVTLICCILFVCIHSMMDDNEGSVRHIRSGLKLFKLSDGNKDGDLNDDSSVMREALATDTIELETENTRDVLLGIIKRLDYVADILNFHIYGHVPVPFNGGDIPIVPEVIVSLAQARALLGQLNVLGINFFQSLLLRKHDKDVGIDEIVSKHKLAIQLDRWQVAFETFLQSPLYREERRKGEKKRQNSVLDQKGHPYRESSLGLQLQHRLVRIYVRSSTEPSECSYDESMDDFEDAVLLAEEIFKTIGTPVVPPRNQDPHAKQEPRPSRTGGRFSFDMGMMIVLHFISVKCRHPKLRRKAASLLKRGPSRVPLWNAALSATLAEMAADMEETGYPQTAAPYPPATSQSQQPAECGSWPFKQPLYADRSELPRPLSSCGSGATSTPNASHNRIWTSQQQLHLERHDSRDISPLTQDSFGTLSLSSSSPSCTRSTSPVSTRLDQEDLPVLLGPKQSISAAEEVRLGLVQLPPEEWRFHDVDFEIKDSLSRKGTRVMFWRKPWGLEGAWDVWNTWISPDMYL